VRRARHAPAQRRELAHTIGRGANHDMRDLAQVIEHVHDRWDQITDDSAASQRGH
jgi:hypothetical protein